MAETLIGTVLGAIIGILITHIYYRRQKEDQILSDALSSFMQEQIESLVLSIKYPEFFESPEAHTLWFFDEVPKNKDIPHLNTVVFEKKELSPGDVVSILIKVSDHKWNFPMVKGIDVTGLFGEKLDIQNGVCGYMATKFKIPSDFGPGEYSLKVSMLDTIGNKNEQIIPIDIL